MKKILCLLIAIVLFSGCSLFRDKLEMKVNKDYVSWKNSTLQISTYRYRDGINHNLPAFEVFTKTADGKNTWMQRHS